MSSQTARYILILSIIASPHLYAEATHDDARALRVAGQILPLGDLLQGIYHQYPGKILGAELLEHTEGYRYRIELLTLDSQMMTLLLDAKTGQILNTDRKER